MRLLSRVRQTGFNWITVNVGHWHSPTSCCQIQFSVQYPKQDSNILHPIKHLPALVKSGHPQPNPESLNYPDFCVPPLNQPQIWISVRQFPNQDHPRPVCRKGFHQYKSRPLLVHTWITLGFIPAHLLTMPQSRLPSAHIQARLVHT